MKLYILDNETKFLFSQTARLSGKGKRKEEDYLTSSNSKKLKEDICVCSEGELNKALAKKENNINEFVILVELDWNNNTVEDFYGYEVAKKILNNEYKIEHWKDKHIDILFISTFKQETIYKIFIDKNRIFTQKFPHKQINETFKLSELEFANWSKAKFEYNRYCCIQKSGIVDSLAHKVNLSNKLLSKEELKKIVEDLKLNAEYLTPEINVIVNELDIEKDDEYKIKFAKLYMLLTELTKKIRGEKDNIEKKYQWRILLVEDNKAFKEKLENDLLPYFNTVTSFSNGQKVIDELEIANQLYDCVITDMELLKECTQIEDEIQGIDIIEKCKKDYPHIAVGIITGLPSTSERMLTNEIMDIKTIFKSTNFSVEELIKNINETVKKRKRLRFMKGPIINWWGKGLTRKMYEVKIITPNDYNVLWSNTFKKYDDFINNNLEIDCELPHADSTTKERRETPQSVYENHIEKLLTHRLIALNFGRNHQSGFSFENDYIIQEGFNNKLSTRKSNQYFSFIGLHTEKPERGSKLMKILFENLFQEEYEWLEKDMMSILIRDYSNDFTNNFCSFFDEYYQLDNSAPPSDINENDLTIKEAIKLLNDFLFNYPEFVIEKSKRKRLKDLFDKEIYANTKDLPESLKNKLEEVKVEIFPD